MKCPTCPDVSLTMTDRQGIEIDYCPQCRGVWLDRGELDKLIERATAAMPQPVSAAVATHPPRQQPEFADSDYERHTSARGGHSNTRKRSWLNSIFD
jgi:uncharacterized protein